MSDQEESVGAWKKCWNCGSIIIESQMNSIWNHSCFASYDENKHAVIIQGDGTVSMVALSVIKRKLAEEIRPIAEISKRPALYDEGLKFKTSFHETEHLWAEAASAVSPEFPANEAKRNWRKLRDQFKKSISSENAKEECQSSNINEQSALREVSQYVMEKRTSFQIAGADIRKMNEGRTLEEALMDESYEENQVHSLNRSWAFNSPSAAEPLSTPGTATQSVSAENVNSRGINTRRSRALNFRSAAEPLSSHDTAPHSVNEENMNKKRINSRPKNNEEALQMLVSEKIRSHKIEKSDPTDMFLQSLGETYKKLDHSQQIRVHRRFIEVLEEEFNEQEFSKTQCNGT